MSRATVELDFFGSEKQTAAHKSQFQKFLDRRRRSCFRGIQNSISRINPEVIRSVIAASGDANQSQKPASSSVPPSPHGRQTLFPALPVLNPAYNECCLPDAAPLTIFYNGSVSVFNVPRDKAESILKFAAEEWSKGRSEDPAAAAAIPSNNDQQLLKSLNGDLPITRRKSLQRFLEKRKERLTSVSPYLC